MGDDRKKEWKKERNKGSVEVRKKKHENKLEKEKICDKRKKERKKENKQRKQRKET